ncbi:DUF6503 family protein [Reichenbachiella sp. 5M10]|uniref:DUF6503 family protein n=1 Tax=Reichenbachiella sp. 5M10 TaxID=1889772 RepID=UPI000C157C9C|nr:DUF6503 family protein [Reichenbachiella sp. 5M10]
MKSLTVILALLLCTSCIDHQSPQEILDAAIKAHGASGFDKYLVEFDFRKKHFTIDHRKGLNEYARTYVDDSLGMVTDHVSRDSVFRRELNGEIVTVTQEEEREVEHEIESVVSFFQLPYGINAPSLSKEYVGKNIVNGQMYYKVKVLYEKRGVDHHHDTFVFWVHEDKHTVDFLGYSYQGENGTGTRFRQAVHRQKILGILFQDYINYQTSDSTVAVENLDELYETGHLERLSFIAKENIRVIR